MAYIKKTVSDSLENVKSNIRDSYQYFQPNYASFNHWMKFIFKSSLNHVDIALAQELQRTQLEFNILEAYVNKQCGEFAKQEPSYEIRQSDNPNKPVDPRIISLIEGYFRAFMDDANRDNLQYLIFREMVGGGFSAAKVVTDYISPESFHQEIYLRKAFDPTLCGWDKMARDTHKGDGKYCFELFPMVKEEFISKYGSKYAEGMNFTRNVEGFSWTYSTDYKDIILIGDYYEKRITTKKIVRLADGSVMSANEYDELLGFYQDNPSLIEMPPTTTGKSKIAEIVKVDRNTVIENAVLDHEQTDYKYLPIIFFDGNSVLVRSGNGNTGASQQLTRPYVYQAAGIQKLKNFAGNSLATELENMVMHKWIVMEEAIPAENTEAYKNVQKADVLVWRGFKDNDPNVPLQPPQAVQRPPVPAEITNAFTVSDQMTQTILGAYDAALGINDNNLSGKAIQAGATNSNHASMPYIVGYMRGLNRVAEVVVDLMPKYLNLKRNISIKNIGGKRMSIPINGDNPNDLKLDFDSDSISVKVEAGVNFELQRVQAFQMLTTLMGLTPVLQEYIGTQEEGIEMLLDNVDVRGIDALKQNIKPFVEKIQKRQQMAEQSQQKAMQQADVPIQMKMQEMKMQEAKMQQDMQTDQMKAQVEMAKTEVAKQDSDTKRMLALAEIGEKTDKLALEQDRMQQEESKIAVSQVNAAVNLADTSHRHAKDMLDLHHTNTRHSKEMEHKQEQVKKQIIGKNKNGNEG